MRFLKLLSFTLMLSILGSLPAFATDVTGTINFGSASGSTNVNAASVTGDDSQGKTWTITTAGTTSFTPNASYAQIGSGNKPASSITFTTTLDNDVDISAFSAKFGGFNGTAGTVTLKVNDETVGTGSLSASTDVTVNKSGTTAVTGSVLTVTVTGISKGVKAYYISYTYDGGGATLSSIAISGDLTTKAYEVGEDLDYTGLTVTGTYSDNSTEDVTSSVEWSFSPDLAVGTTSYTVTASIGNVSEDKTITGITVVPALSKSTLIFSAKCNGSGTADDDVAWTVTSDATSESTFDNTKGIHYGTSSVAVSYLRLSTSEIKGTIKKVKVNTSGASGTSGIVSVAVGGTAFNIFDDQTTTALLTTSAIDYMFTGSATGTILVSITQNSAKKALYCKSIVVSYEAPEPAAVAKPTFTLADGSYLGSQSVEINCETDGADIYYTMGDNPADPTSESTPYTGAITVNSTTAIKAIAIKGSDESDIASATYIIINHAGTAADPYSVADARTVIDAGIGLADKYVHGIVSAIVEHLNTTYHNISYNFSDDGLTTSDQLEAYRGKSYNGGNFTSNDDIQVGDEVVVHGTLNKYGSTYEFDAGNQLVKRSAHLSWNGTTEGAYAASLEGGNTFPTLTNSDNVSVSYSSSETSVATINASNGNIDLVGAGSTNITATFTGNDTYFEKSASYTLNVSSTVIKADILFEENGGSAVTDMQAQSNLPSPLPTTTKAGYNFGGWFMDSEFNTSAVAGAAVTSSDPITLYAKWLDPYSVGVALTMINALADNEKTDNVYVIGVVDNHATSLSSTSINYNIKDANASNTLAVYKGKGLKTDLAPTGEDVTSADYVQEGDQVVVYGQLYKYVDKNSNTTPEIAQGSYMFSKVRPAVAVTGIDLTESTAEVEVGSTVTLHASVVPGNATNKTINWTVESGSDKASVQDGVVSGLAVGTAVIRAASDEDATIYAECTVTVTAADPTKHVVTFDATVDTEIFTKDNITMSCPNGALSNGSEYRLYKNSETTFECSAGNITKIEFTGVSGNPVSGFKDPAEGTLETSGNDGVWTGNVASVTFTASGAQVRASLIKVTYKEDTRAESGLAWNPADDIELTVGDAFTAPTLTNPHSLTVSITSDNTDLATVTAGVVTLVADATGEATITATFAGNDDYKPATVSYKITVNGGALTDYYEKVTSGAVAEGTYLIVYETTSVAFDGSLETLDATSNTIDVTITNDHKIAVTQATAASTFYIDPTAGTIKSASGKYIGRTTSSNGMNTSATEAFTNTISIDNDGNAVIVGSSTTATYLRYNPSSGQTRFRYFTQNQQAIQLYKLANEVIKPAAGLAWDPADDIELTVGETFTAPTLQNPNNIATNEISITSSNTNLATVNNGIVELVADATGTTTIKATFAGNDDYKAAEVSYKIKVNPLSSIVVTPSLKVNFGSVEQGATLPDNQAITVTLTNVAAATATLGGTNPEAFGIDKTALVEGDNVINISVASTATAGDFKATIVITDNATENPAASKTVNISLKVTEPAAKETPVSTTSKWVAATAADLVDGKEVLITGAKEGTVYAMGEQKTNNRAAVAGTLDEGVFTPGENSMSVTLVDQGNNTFALMTSDGQYLYAASSSANQLKKRTAIGDDNNAIWTVAVDALTANGSNRGVMQFNYSATNQLFSCYASASSSYIAIALYVPQTTPPTPTYTEIRTGLQSGRYYSLCYPKKMTAIKGGTLWSFAGKEADMAYLEQAEAPYAAGQPYFIYAESDKFEAVLEGDATSTAGNNNGLYGTLVDMTNSDLLAAGATYLLKNNELHPLGEAYLSAYKAYVIVENINGGKPAATSGKQVRSMPLHVDTTTGLDELNTSETPTKVIINGQLFIIRGEKMFDATGRLVK